MVKCKFFLPTAIALCSTLLIWTFYDLYNLLYLVFSSNTSIKIINPLLFFSNYIFSTLTSIFGLIYAPFFIKHNQTGMELSGFQLFTKNKRLVYISIFFCVGLFIMTAYGIYNSTTSGFFSRPTFNVLRFISVTTLKLAVSFIVVVMAAMKLSNKGKASPSFNYTHQPTSARSEGTLNTISDTVTRQGIKKYCTFVIFSTG